MGPADTAGPAPGYILHFINRRKFRQEPHHMKKIIIPYLLLAAALTGCSQGNADWKPDQSTTVPKVYTNPVLGSDAPEPVVLQGNTHFSGPGHNAGLIEDGESQTWIIYHAYQLNAADAGRMGMLDLVAWGSDGWPSVYDGTPSSVFAIPKFGSAE